MTGNLVLINDHSYNNNNNDRNSGVIKRKIKNFTVKCEHGEEDCDSEHLF